VEVFILRLQLLLLIFFGSAFVYGAELRINCGNGDRCESFKENNALAIKSLKSHQDIWEKLKTLSVNESIKRFEIKSFRASNNVVYQLDIVFKKKINDIEINFPGGYSDELESFLVFKVDQYFNSQLVDMSKKRILENLVQRGYLKPTVNFRFLEEGDDVSVIVNVTASGQRKVEKVELSNTQQMLDFEIENRLMSFQGEAYDKLKIGQRIEEIQRDLVENGHYNAKLDFREVSLDNNNVLLQIDINLGKRFNFSFEGNKSLSTIDLITSLKREIVAGNLVLEKSEIKNAIVKLYEEISVYNSKVSIAKREGAYRNKVPLENYYIKVVEGKKLRISKLFFKGNQRIRLAELEELFYDNASVVVGRGYFDEKYITKFNELVKNFYLERGFLLSSVKSNISLSDDGAEIMYTIIEGQRCVVRDINISGISTELANEIKSKLINKGGKAFNVLALEEDIKKVIFEIKEKGFFFASLRNYTPDKILSYFANYSLVEINLDFKTGKKLVYNDLNIQGLVKTENKTVRRENFFEVGETITPTKIEKLSGKITSLGLFSSISIKPNVLNKFTNAEEYKTNLNLFLNEKNPGTGIIAPGYRTDLGAKFSFSLLYRNLYGLNHAVSLKTQFNRRFTLGDLDARRKADKHHFIETSLNLNYSWPYFLDYFDFDIGSSFQRRRAFSFDADILRLSPRLSKQFNDYFSSSLRYQLEDIRQTDATNEKDDARFRIGSLTPSITFDFRDSAVAPKSGTYFNLSWEFGNPYFGAQKGKNFEINYSKIVSRNRFYYPLKNKIVVFALSVSMGYQVNYADELRLNADGSRVLNSDDTFQTKGYIPSIKVFRLDGQDTVRGFSNSEINRLNNGIGISDVRVQNTAYFTNLKFEPRYYLSDSIGLGLFFDAGRVYVNHFQPLSLRTSVGGSFKFLTPVGSLDFDYGIKTERNRLNDGGKEGFGRFHLSIGLF
jgi:outer membrane protein insertion porin family